VVPEETAVPMAVARKRRGRKHPGVVLIKPSSAKRMGWRARYTDPDSGRSVYTSLDAALTHAEQREKWAVEKSRELTKRRLALEGGAVRATGIALSDACDRYFTAHVRLSERSKLDYRAATNKLVVWAKGAGVRSADELTRPKLIAFRERLVSEPKRVVVKSSAPRPTTQAARDLAKQVAPPVGRGKRQESGELRAPETVNGELRKVRTVLGYLRRLDLLPRLRDDDLRDALKRLSATVERIEFLQPRACQQLLEAALRHDAETHKITRAEKAGERPLGTTARYVPIAPFTAFVLLSGMRRSEALELEWHQVDLDALDGDGRKVGEIYLAGAEVKTKRARTVGLEVSSALRTLLSALHLQTGGRGRVFDVSEGKVEAAAKNLKQTYGAPATFSWQVLRRTCGTFLTNAPGIFGAASAYRSAKQLGHSVAVAERHYLGLVRGIPREARTLEAAMQIESVMGRVVAAVGAAPSAVVLVPGPRGRQTQNQQ
jgi:integrase